MSTKSTIFFTNENEHCYIDQVDNTVVLEMDRKNFQVLMEDADCVVIQFNENSTLAKEFEKLFAQQYEISRLKKQLQKEKIINLSYLEQLNQH